MMRMMRSIVPACLFGAGLLGLTALSGCGKAPAFEPPPPPKVQVATPVQQDVVLYFEVPGRLKAVQSVAIPARVQGFIEKIAFKDGEFVEAGQLLFEIEPQEYEAVVAQSKAAVASAKAAHKLAESRYEKVKKAAEAKAASPVELLEAEAKRDQAAADIDAAQAALDRAELDLGYTKVTAPFAGRISESLVDVGAYVSGGGGTTLAQLKSLDPIYVDWNASERGVLEFRKRGQTLPRSESGQEIPDDKRIPVKLKLADGTIFEHDGFIDYVSPSIDSSTGTLPARARMPNPQFNLFPGQYGYLLIHKYKGPAILVPEAALQRDVVGSYLLLVDEKKNAVRRNVEIGDLYGQGMRIITGGLEAGDRVIVTGVQKARPGSPVDPQPTELEPVEAPGEDAPESPESPDPKTTPDAPASPDVSDASDYEIRIWLDAEMMKAHGLTAEQVIDALQEQDIELTARRTGSPAPESAGLEYVVTNSGKLADMQAFDHALVNSNEDGGVIRIADIARVTVTSLQKAGSVLPVDSQPSDAPASPDTPDA